MVCNTLMNSLLSLRQEKQLRNVSSTYDKKSRLKPRHSRKDLPVTHTEFHAQNECSFIDSLNSTHIDINGYELNVFTLDS